MQCPRTAAVIAKPKGIAKGFAPLAAGGSHNKALRKSLVPMRFRKTTRDDKASPARHVGAYSVDTALARPKRPDNPNPSASRQSALAQKRSHPMRAAPAATVVP
ncbi:hypothetical protein JCM15519_07590 [Fundidesulfovibrio butyratiphilus]